MVKAVDLNAGGPRVQLIVASSIVLIPHTLLNMNNIYNEFIVRTYEVPA